MAFDTSDAITVTDVRDRVHQLVEEDLQFRQAYLSMTPPAGTDDEWSIPIDSDNLAKPGEIGAGSHYPTDEEGFSTVTATRRKFGQAIPVHDEAQMDNVFAIVDYLSNKMARKMQEKLDSEAQTVLDGNLNTDSPVTDAGGSAGTMEYGDILGGVRELALDGYDPDLAIIEPNGEEDLRNDSNFVRATDRGDAVVREGTVDRVAGMDVVVSNTGDVTSGEAYLVDTQFYGAEVTWVGMEAEEAREALKDTDYLKLRTFRDWVALDSEAAIKVQD